MTGLSNFSAGLGSMAMDITAELISNARPLSLYALQKQNGTNLLGI